MNRGVGQTRIGERNAGKEWKFAISRVITAILGDLEQSTWEPGIDLGLEIGWMEVFRSQAWMFCVLRLLCITLPCYT